jgi:hypothetical protein
MSLSPAPVSITLAAALPQLQPEDPGARLLLFGIRQMGAHGLHDASTAHAFLIAFGKRFQRPLVLLRALMQELSAHATSSVQIAPWCCPRITSAEAALLRIVGRVGDHPFAANLLLADLLGVRDASGVLPTAHALSRAFADLALPIEA